MEKKLKSWQGWLLFGGSMVVVFVLGLCVSALMERRAEVASIFNNRKNVIKGIEARNELFKDDFPREYQTWTETAKTDFESEFNGNIAVDALEKRPEMVILWAGYAFSKDYSTPRGHMHLRSAAYLFTGHTTVQNRSDRTEAAAVLPRSRNHRSFWGWAVIFSFMSCT